MVTPIVMPQLGETLVEGTLIKWLKREGERVELDEPLFEISTDKVDTEVPSPVTGALVGIKVAEGETVAVGTELAGIDDGASGGAVREVITPELATEDDPLAEETPGRGAPDGRTTTAVGPSVLATAGGGPRSAIVSPLVRRMAAQHAIDLTQLTGTGNGGRITKHDVEAFLASRPSDTGRGDAPEPAPVPPNGPPSLSVVPAGPREEVVPLTHIRRQIASHMHESLQISARAWTAVEVDMERIARSREREKESFRTREGFSLTYLPFLARATCEALLEFPEVNAELRGEDLLLRRYVNLGIAVAYDDGLIVPVIHDAEASNLTGLARLINDLATRARTRRLQPEEVGGSTFTITNPGSFGSLTSVPIINQPNSAIMSFDAIQKRPVVIDDAIAIRHMVYLSLSWDHRVIDGALATRFLVRVKEHLEGWDFAEDLGP